MPLPTLSGRIAAAVLAAALLPINGDLNAARPDFAPPNWTQASAREASFTVDIVAELKPLFALARAGQDDDLLRALQALASDDRLPLPARERLLQEFAQGLSDLPARQLAPDLVAWLLAWQPRTLVPHEESPGVGTPLYNVAAASAGSLNGWIRQLAAAESEQWLLEDPDTWLAAWLSATGVHRQGLADALEGAPAANLRALANAVLGRLPDTPELGGLTSRIALLLADPQLFSVAAAAGTSDGMAAALRSARAIFDSTELATILRQIVREATAPIAALAIAELGPVLSDRAEIEKLLFELLADPGLGAASSLVLANSSDPLVQARLDELARQPQGLAATRAALARAIRQGGQAVSRESEMQP